MSAFWKSILGAIVAGLTSLVTASMDDPATSVNESVITWPEGLTAVIAVLVALGAVAAVPNAGFIDARDKTLSSNRTVAPAVFEAFTGHDWVKATPVERDNSASAVRAVVSALRR